MCSLADWPCNYTAIAASHCGWGSFFKLRATTLSMVFTSHCNIFHPDHLTPCGFQFNWAAIRDAVFPTYNIYVLPRLTPIESVLKVNIKPENDSFNYICCWHKCSLYPESPASTLVNYRVPLAGKQMFTGLRNSIFLLWMVILLVVHSEAPPEAQVGLANGFFKQSIHSRGILQGIEKWAITLTQTLGKNKTKQTSPPRLNTTLFVKCGWGWMVEYLETLL